MNPKQCKSLRRSAVPGLVLLCVSVVPGGCKPERPDIQKSRQAEAESEASKIKARLSDDTARKRLQGGLDPEAIPADKANVVVAQVGATKITVRDVAAEIAKEPPHMQARYSSPEKRRALLQQMVDFELLVQAALREGLDAHPKVRATYKAALAKALLAKLPKVPPTAVSDAEIEAYYNEHRDAFKTPEMRRGAMLVVDSTATASKLRGLIEGAIVEAPLKARQIFGDWVAKRSLDKATRVVKGDLGFVDAEGRTEKRRIKPPPEALKVLYGMGEVSAISKPFKLADGRYALLQWTGHRPAVQQSLEAARMEVRGKLLRAKNVAARQAFIDDLKSKATIAYEDDALSKATIALGAQTPKQGAPGKAKGGAKGEGKTILKPNDTSALRRLIKKNPVRGDGVRPAPTTARPTPTKGSTTAASPKVDHKKVQEAIQERKRKAEEKREKLSLP